MILQLQKKNSLDDLDGFVENRDFSKKKNDSVVEIDKNNNKEKHDEVDFLNSNPNFYKENDKNEKSDKKIDFISENENIKTDLLISNEDLFKKKNLNEDFNIKSKNISEKEIKKDPNEQNTKKNSISDLKVDKSLKLPSSEEITLNNNLTDPFQNSNHLQNFNIHTQKNSLFQNQSLKNELIHDPTSFSLERPVKNSEELSESESEIRKKQSTINLTSNDILNKKNLENSTDSGVLMNLNNMITESNDNSLLFNQNFKTDINSLKNSNKNSNLKNSLKNSNMKNSKKLRESAFLKNSKKLKESNFENDGNGGKKLMDSEIIDESGVNRGKEVFLNMSNSGVDLDGIQMTQKNSLV